MPEDVIQNPELGGAGEAIDTTEVPVSGESQTPTDAGTSGDPLDDIQDPEARAEAKKFRAIARRNADRPEAPKAPQAPSQPAAGVAKLVTFNAKQLVSDEVKANWDELQSIPLGGYDANDPESIAQNMTDRLAILKAKPQKQNGARDLVAQPGIQGRTGTQPASEQKPMFPRALDVDAQAEKLYGKS